MTIAYGKDQEQIGGNHPRQTLYHADMPNPIVGIDLFVRFVKDREDMETVNGRTSLTVQVTVRND